MRLWDSIDAHLQIVIASLAVSRWIEETMGWSIRRFVRTLRVYRNATDTIGGQKRSLPPSHSRMTLPELSKRSRPELLRGTSLSQVGTLSSHALTSKPCSSRRGEVLQRSSCYEAIAECTFPSRAGEKPR